jgi:V8-like Glu-specific endopeptidase
MIVSAEAAMTWYVDAPHDYPHSAVVHLITSWSDGSESSGSGVVVDTNDVLTAGHMVWDAVLGPAVSVTATPGQHGWGDDAYATYQAAGFQYLDWDADADGLVTQAEAANDIAVLSFSDAIGNETGWMGLDPDFTGGPAFVTGFPGVYDEDTMSEDRGYAYAESTYVRAGWGWGWGRHGTWEDTGTINIEDFDINPGNSGGPVWQYEDGLPYVYGVVSTGSWASDIGNHWDEITGWIAGDDGLLTAA